MINTVKKPRGKKVSLRLTFLIFLVIASVLSVATFLLFNSLGIGAIDKYYMSEDASEKREAEYVSDLQDYITDNGLTTKDTARIAKWVRENKYLYVMLFTPDDELILDSGMAENEANKEEPKDPNGEAGDGAEDGGEEDGAEDVTPPEGGVGDVTQPPEDEKPDYKPGGLINTLTEEQLIELARANDSHAIELADGTIFASMADFSEYLYYDIINIASLVLAALFFVAIVMIFFYGVTGRITKLSDDVTRVAEGEMDHKIEPIGGRDELSTLSVNVENMRSSIIKNIESERAAMNANSELITAMSHDIRTPLTVLLGYIDMMKLHSNDETMSEYIKATENTALRLKTLSDDMFNYFLMFGGSAPDITPEEYNAGTLLEQILTEYTILLKEQGYDIDMEEDAVFAENLYEKTVLVDASALMRMVENVFSNIFKYADKGRPVRICISEENELIKLSFRNHISAEGGEHKSSGIGLKTCKKLSELLDIDFDTVSDDGIFEVRIALKSITPKDKED